MVHVSSTKSFYRRESGKIGFIGRSVTEGALVYHRPPAMVLFWCCFGRNFPLVFLQFAGGSIEFYWMSVVF